MTRSLTVKETAVPAGFLMRLREMPLKRPLRPSLRKMLARAAKMEVVRLMEAKWARGASLWGAPKTYETLRIG